MIVRTRLRRLRDDLQMISFAKEAPPAEPTTKECPFCFSVIPIKAVRCGYCTSELK